MPKRQTSASAALPSSPTTPAEEGGRFHIARYHASRHFALYDAHGLVTVTVYKKGAKAVQERLEADARTIKDLQRQVADLAACFHIQATPTPRPTLAESFNLQPPWRPPRQLRLLAEDLTAYRIIAPQRPVLRREHGLPVAYRKDLATGTKIYYYGKKEVRSCPTSKR
jgi:hypothetical protein